MNTGKTLLIAAFSVLPALNGREIRAQSLDLTLARLKTSQIDTAKESALYALLKLGASERFPVCSPEAAAQIKGTLITALEQENEVWHSADASTGSLRLSETESEYYAHLVSCVASLQDRAALRGLLGAIDTGWGAIDGIVLLGEHAVPALLKLLDTPGSLGRVPALKAVGKLASRKIFPQTSELLPPLPDAMLTAIRARLLTALADENRFARVAALTALSSYSDLEIRRAVQVIAATDSATKETGNGKRDFPVRRAAQDWLKRDSLKVRKASP